MSITTEVRKISLHPLAIHTFIKAQAGSLGKALSEAVMNSIDAFATTVHVTVNGQGFAIEDNGQGFREMAEIEAWFETLGFPHDDGNHRLYGSFGMGRSQLWGFAKTTWKSNQFVMKVDVQHKGLDYDLDISTTPFKGTRIEAEFYEELAYAKQQQVEIELQNLVRYVPGAVFINGQLANRDPALESWDLETPEAYFKFEFEKKRHTLDVYNAGLLVSHFPEYRYGCTGIVVTKPNAALSLNIARNEIIEKTCKVWAKVVKSLPKKDQRPAAPKALKLSKNLTLDLGRQVKAGVFTLEEALIKAPHLLINVLGRPVKLYELASYYRSSPVVFVPKGDEFGKRISKLKAATVIANETLENFAMTVVEFKEMIRQTLLTEGGAGRFGQPLTAFDEASWGSDAKAMFPVLSAGKQQYNCSELTPSEKAAAAAWTRARIALNNQLKSVLNSDQERKLYSVRNTSLGDCPLGESSWTDEATGTLVLNKKLVTATMSRPLPVVTKYAITVFMTLCTHIGGGADEGKSLLLRLLSETEALGTFILNLTRFYVNECRKADITIEPTRLADLDNLHTM